MRQQTFLTKLSLSVALRYQREVRLEQEQHPRGSLALPFHGDGETDS